MTQTLFLGVATVLVAVGSFLASIEHRYTAYGCFVGAIAMVAAAVWATYRSEYRLKRGKEKLGRILVELSECELAAYRGKDGSDYDKLLGRINKLKDQIVKVGEKYLDSSIGSRFLAVNVLDIRLDKATKLHFMERGAGSFWTMYQQIKGWRACVEQLLRELPRA
jgi:hypothetical protein